jgi:hypothetical protein
MPDAGIGAWGSWVVRIHSPDDFGSLFPRMEPLNRKYNAATRSAAIQNGFLKVLILRILLMVKI